MNKQTIWTIQYFIVDSKEINNISNEPKQKENNLDKNIKEKDCDI